MYQPCFIFLLKLERWLLQNCQMSVTWWVLNHIILWMKLYICCSAYQTKKNNCIWTNLKHLHTLQRAQNVRIIGKLRSNHNPGHTHPTLQSMLLCSLSLSLSCYRFPFAVVWSCCVLQVTSLQPFYKSHDNHIGLTNANLLNNDDDDDNLKRGNII